MTRITVLLVFLLSMCVSCAITNSTAYKYDYNVNPDKTEKQYYWDSEYCGKWARDKAVTGGLIAYDMDKFEKVYCECMEKKGWRKKK
ncbi:MAG: hypothetical protein H8D67_18840 [Deltaproteobacteria bacterium]|nr:hypothetical protein [Deltaproteobacteria bacterium]